MSYGTISTQYSSNINYNAALTAERLMKILSIAISIIIWKLCNYVIEYISVIKRLPSLLALVSLRSPPTFREAIGDFIGEHHLARLTVDHTPVSDGYHTVIKVKAYISYIYGG
jgi:hypothetical protein